MRIHGTTGARPLEVFDELERAALLPVPAALRCSAAAVGEGAPRLPRRDRQSSLLGARATTSATPCRRPGRLRAGETVPPRPADQDPPPATRRRPQTDPADLPAERAGYAMRDLDRLVATAAGHGETSASTPHRLLDDPLPWTRMRAVYRLLGLVRRYGPGPVDTACGTALDLDVVSRRQDRRDARQSLGEHRSRRCRPRPVTRPAGSPATRRFRSTDHSHPRARPTARRTHASTEPCTTTTAADAGPGRPARLGPHRAAPHPEAVRDERHPPGTALAGPDPPD